MLFAISFSPSLLSACNQKRKGSPSLFISDQIVLLPFLMGDDDGDRGFGCERTERVDADETFHLHSIAWLHHAERMTYPSKNATFFLETEILWQKTTFKLKISELCLTHWYAKHEKHTLLCSPNKTKNGFCRVFHRKRFEI
jgi:hypothetical protein